MGIQFVYLKSVLLSFLVLFGLSSVSLPTYAKDDDKCRTLLSEPVEWAGKIVVLDTNVLLDDPRAIYHFPGAEVIIPLVVLEELDSKKTLQEMIGKNAREFSRMLDRLRQQGPLVDGIDLGNGAKIKVSYIKDQSTENLPYEFGFSKMDNQILRLVKELDKSQPNKVHLISKDTNIRLKADVLGIPAYEYSASTGAMTSQIDRLPSGAHKVTISGKQWENYKDTGRMAPPEDLELAPNEFVLFDIEGREEISLASLEGADRIARYNPHKKALVPLNMTEMKKLAIDPKNLEQVMALELLLNDDIKLVNLSGKAGTGKTFLSLAAALQKVLLDSHSEYDGLMIARHIIPMGKDPGALPGTIEDKVGPFLKPFYDNLAQILEYIALKEDNHNEYAPGQPESSKQARRRKRRQQKVLRQHRYDAQNSDFRGNGPDGDNELTSVDNLIKLGVVSMEPLSYIRGRSIPNKILIIDEAQNLEPHEVKTILTRAGENTKIILLGDLGQIDTPYLTAVTSGFAEVIRRSRDSEISSHIELKKGERSRLADEATDWFK
ncbi:MAG: PhoH family protein [Pseudobdellovibrionaceae bacterium]|nr:PhoH family protein [Bdellovibrionales bacterium]USN47390.1 MAG: PhoH family protein [Pseudobdellovibrionaceae bacterium]